MGELKDKVKERSLWIRLEIGEKSEPMIYKSWKEITGGIYGDSFRYIFEIETPKGLMAKQFDCPQAKFAEQMDVIPFGKKVIIHRQQKYDIENKAIAGKGIYVAEVVD